MTTGRARRPHRETFSDGARLAWPAEHTATLIAGEVLVVREGRPIELWRAPCPLDVAGSIRSSVSTCLVAVGSAEIESTPHAELPPAELTARLAAENAMLWARVDQDARRDDDTFLDGARPVPGPWWFRSADAVAMVVQGDARRIADCLPRRVVPLPGTRGRFVLALTRFEGVGSEDPRDTRRFVYHEVTPFIPVWSGCRGPAAFIPELYPDAWMAVILGREILGFPKRTARIAFREDGGEMIVDGRLALRVRWQQAQAIKPANALGALAERLMPGAPVHGLVRAVVGRFGDKLGFSALVHKRIGAAATAGQTDAIDELVRVPVKLDAIAGAERLTDVVAEISTGPGILHGQVLGAWRIKTGMRFGRGKFERHARPLLQRGVRVGAAT